MAKNTFHAVIVSPDEIIFEGDVEKMIVPGIFQDLAILPNHTPLYAQISKGTISTNQGNGKTNTFPVDSGIIRVKRNNVSVLIGFEANLP